MNLIDMKVPVDYPSGGMAVEAALQLPTPKAEYPYGLRITMETKTLAKLGIDVTDFSVGEDFSIVAICEVCEISQRETSSPEGTYDRMELQIKKLGVGKQGKATTIEDALESAKDGRRKK